MEYNPLPPMIPISACDKDPLRASMVALQKGDYTEGNPDRRAGFAARVMS